MLYIIVVESKSDNKIIGTITVLFEEKFIRNLGVVSHIEDVVVDREHRKNKIGSRLMDICIELSSIYGCYKIILDCDQQVKDFYTKKGFKEKSIGMSLYFEHTS